MNSETAHLKARKRRRQYNIASPYSVLFVNFARIWPERYLFEVKYYTHLLETKLNADILLTYVIKGLHYLIIHSCYDLVL